MATKAKKTATTYTVRIEWPVTYYCDTTVEATSPEEAARIAMEDPDYDNQRSYDESGDSIVQGVCEGEDYDYGQHQEVAGCGDSYGMTLTTVEAGELREAILAAACRIHGRPGDAEIAQRLRALACKIPAPT